MKRSRAAVKIQQQHDAIERDDKRPVSRTQLTSNVILDQRPKLNLRSLRNRNSKDVDNIAVPDVTASAKKSESIRKDPKLETLIKEGEESKSSTNPSREKRRAIVDLEMMKEELSQLEDPPITPWEKELSSDRLRYEFFDIPCEELAQQLLGKILVRCLENGTILKGRIVETEGYLGAIDKAAQSYQNKVTPRNLPMYMPPGTVYVYMTYGMYHCFNISSREVNAHVLVRAVEPLVGLDYMELLRNMRLKDDGREKQIARRATRLKQHELCNNPFKICDAFAIDQEAFDRKPVYASSSLWFESDGCAVLVRAVDPLEGTEHMADQRKMSKTKKAALKPHELCNGPSKLCMAYQLDRQHSKYSVCTWKSLWLEDDDTSSDFIVIKSTRIGIDSSGPEWASKLLRYYIYGNKSVSKRDKKAEMDISRSV